MSTAAATPNVADPTGFTIYRALDGAGPWPSLGTVPPTIAGTSATATFTDSGLTSGTTYYYQVVANNLVGDTQVYGAGTGYPNVSADFTSTVTSAVAK